MKSQEIKLRTTLKANAAFSLSSGLVMVSFGKPISTLMNISNPLVLLILGVGLVLFAAYLIYNASKLEISRTQVKFIILQDWIWVIGSLILLIIKPLDISFIGNILIGLVAIIVGVLAILQTNFLKTRA